MGGDAADARPGAPVDRTDRPRIRCARCCPRRSAPRRATTRRSRSWWSRSTSSDGIVGYGEGLARRGAAAYARFIDEVLAPRLIGTDAGRPARALEDDARRALGPAGRADWSRRSRRSTSRSGTSPAKRPTSRSTSCSAAWGAARVAAYASSINWLDDATVEAEVAAALAAGFREIKVKLGHPLKDAIARGTLRPQARRRRYRALCRCQLGL